MHILRAYAEEINGLAGLVAEAASNPVSQGVILDLNPFWLSAYRAARAGIGLDLIANGFPYYSWFSIAEWLELTEIIDGDQLDLSWKDASGWVGLATQSVFGGPGKNIAESSLPFLVRVLAKPTTRTSFDLRGKLVALAVQQTFPAVVETRSLGALAASPGDGCQAGVSSGTIGGFLKDSITGSRFATTCGHVASPHMTVSVGGSPLGLCSKSYNPVQLTSGQTCHSGCSGMNRLDFALIDIGQASVANVSKAIAATIAPGQNIILRAKRGPKSFQVGGTALSYNPGVTNVCFGNLFEVRNKPYRGILHPKVAAFFASPPKQGDSGAWVELASNSDWCGVLVAADTHTGYALEADDVISRSDKAIGTKLTLI